MASEDQEQRKQSISGTLSSDLSEMQKKYN